MSLDKFGRNYKIIVDSVDRDLTSLNKTSKSKYNSFEDPVIIQPPFSVEFDVVRDNHASVNNMTLTVHNLSKTNRNILRKDQITTEFYRPIEMWAGYGTGEPPSLSVIENARRVLTSPFPRIFRGNVTRCYSLRHGVDFVTKFECQDAGFSIVNSDFVGTFTKGTPKMLAIKALIKALEPTVTLGAVGNFEGNFKGDYQAFGNPKERLVELTGGKFFIDNEKAYCLNDDEFLDGISSIPTISDENGIIGMPVMSGQLVTVDLMFEPGLVIGQRLNLKCRSVDDYNGDYSLCGLSHRGTISPVSCGTLTTSITLSKLAISGIPITAL